MPACHAAYMCGNSVCAFFLAAMRHNAHVHVLALDGVYVREDPGGALDLPPAAGAPRVRTLKPTAGRAIELLVAAGVLVEITDKKRCYAIPRRP